MQRLKRRFPLNLGEDTGGDGRLPLNETPVDPDNGGNDYRKTYKLND